MGGRSSGGLGNQEKVATQESQRKMPSTGPKVQQAFIDYVKRQTKVDLGNARDTQFDNRAGFNIDTRQLTRNELFNVKSLLQRYSGGYDAEFTANGAYREYIRVKRKKK